VVTISPHSSDEQGSGTAYEVYEASWECDAHLVLHEGGRMWQCSEKLYDHPVRHCFEGRNYYIHWTDDGHWERIHKR
jgi:hypothetical protein